MLCNVLILGNIEVLEHWLEVNSFDLDCLSVLFKDHVDLSNFFIGHVEVLLSGKCGVIDSYWSNSSSWNFLDAVGSESSVDIGTEINVVEHVFWVICFVLESERVELLFGQVEIEHREDALELIFGNFSLS